MIDIANCSEGVLWAASLAIGGLTVLVIKELWCLWLLITDKKARKREKNGGDPPKRGAL